MLTVDGKRIHHAGDTALTHDMSLVGDEGIDLAMVPIGDNFTMGIDDAVKAGQFLRAALTVPMHYDTFDVIEQDPAQWARQVEQKTSARVKVLAPGESVRL